MFTVLIICVFFLTEMRDYQVSCIVVLATRTRDINWDNEHSIAPKRNNAIRTSGSLFRGRYELIYHAHRQALHYVLYHPVDPGTS